MTFSSDLKKVFDLNDFRSHSSSAFFGGYCLSALLQEGCSNDRLQEWNRCCLVTCATAHCCLFPRLNSVYGLFFLLHSLWRAPRVLEVRLTLT